MWMWLHRRLSGCGRAARGLLGLALLTAACAPTAGANSAVTLQDILNTVQVTDANGQWVAAHNGDALAPGTGVRTGENSLVRLAFAAGPAVRLSSNTTLAFEAAGASGRLRLEAGRVRLSLSGSRFSLTTALGQAELDGFADVIYQAGDQAGTTDDSLYFRCFSGPCQLQLPAGPLTLANMEAATLAAGGQTSIVAALTELDLRQFVSDNPGSINLLATLTAAPTATHSPTPATPTRAPTTTAAAGGQPVILSSTPKPATNTPTPTATFTRAPNTPTPRFSATPATPPPTDTTAPANSGGGDPPPTQPPPTPPPPTQAPPPTNTPIPPPTDTPLPPTAPPKPPTDTPTP